MNNKCGCFYPLGRLGDLVRGIRGVSYKPDDLRKSVEEDTTVLLRSNNIQDGCLNFDDIQIVPTSIVSEQQILNEGDVAVCMSNGSRQLVGKSGVYDGSYSEKLTVGAFCSIFRCFEQDDVDYVRYLFQSREYQHAIDVLLAGSAINNIKNSDIESILLPIAPKEKRARIAEVLRTVDKSIQATITSISKRHMLKKGVVADLFSFGIDPVTGMLRLSEQNAPELYNKTPLGILPREWKVECLGNWISSIDQGWSPDCESVSTSVGDWGVLKTTAVTWQGYSSAENKALPKNFIAKPRYEVNVGDVLMTRAGPNHRVGVVAYVDKTQKRLMLSDKLYRVNVKSGLSQFFTSLMLSCNHVQRQLDISKTGLADSQSNISQDIIKSLWGIIPDAKEQKLIEDAIASFNMAQEKDLLSLAKLRQQKAGLMQDLLTGKVPVSA